MITATFNGPEEILAELQYRRTFIWDADPSDCELWEMAEGMADDGCTTEEQIDAWLMELT
jgi:hypothetical protein